VISGQQIAVKDWIEDTRRNQAMIEAAVPGAGVEICPEPQRFRPALAQACAWPCTGCGEVLRDDAELRLDFLSNVTGVDWPDKEISEKVMVTRQVTKTVDGCRAASGRDRRRDAEARRAGVSRSGLSPVFDGEKARACGPQDAHREPGRPGGVAFADAQLAVGGVSGAGSFDLYGVVFTGIRICGGC